MQSIACMYVACCRNATKCFLQNITFARIHKRNIVKPVQLQKTFFLLLPSLAEDMFKFDDVLLQFVRSL